jgi:small subunit ribosomal protein S6
MRTYFEGNNQFMKNYELLFILPGTLTEEEVLPFGEKVKTIVVEAGGESVSIRDLKKNRLAYPIRHIRYGYFQICHFEADPDSIAEMQKKFAVIPELLRALIQLYDPKKQKEIETEHFTTAERARAPKSAEKKRVQRGMRLEEVPVAKKTKEKKEKQPKKRVSLEEIGQELDKILDSDISSV